VTLYKKIKDGHRKTRIINNVLDGKHQFIPKAFTDYFVGKCLSEIPLFSEVQICSSINQEIFNKKIFMDLDTEMSEPSLTHSLAHSRSSALLRKLPIVQLFKNFPAIYGTRRFITVFTRALHWSLS
jgi:hypothetical protein